MKKLIISLLTLLPAGLIAQPIVSNNEFYNIGDVINMVNSTSIGTGSAGANITWDFSGIGPTGGLSITTIAHDTSAEFSTSNLLITLPDGSIEHMQENSSDSYINGFYDKSGNTLYSYYDYDIAKRPFTYNTAYVDTYKLVANPVTVGIGYISELGDAYGTLKLPTGTYTNVLRIRKEIIEADSVDGSLSAFKTTISYLWFDGLHKASLFRIDSVTGDLGTTNTAMYLSATTALNAVNNPEPDYKGLINGNGLQLMGNFGYGKTYDVVVFDLVGREIFNQPFTASGGAVGLDLNQQVVPGMYLVGIIPQDQPGSRSVLKVVKQ